MKTRLKKSKSELMTINQKHTIRALINYKEKTLERLVKTNTLFITVFSALTFYTYEKYSPKNAFAVLVEFLSYDVAVPLIKNKILHPAILKTWSNDCEKINQLPEETKIEADFKIKELQKEINTLSLTARRRIILADISAMLLLIIIAEWTISFFSMMEIEIDEDKLTYATIMGWFAGIALLTFPIFYPLLESAVLTIKDFLETRWYRNNVENLSKFLNNKKMELQEAFPFDVTLRDLQLDCLENSAIEIQVDKKMFLHFMRKSFLENGIVFELNPKTNKMTVPANQAFHPNLITSIHSQLSNDVNQFTSLKKLRSQLYKLANTLDTSIFPRLITINKQRQCQFYLKISKQFELILNEISLPNLFCLADIKVLKEMDNLDAWVEIHATQPIHSDLLNNILSKIKSIQTPKSNPTRKSIFIQDTDVAHKKIRLNHSVNASDKARETSIFSNHCNDFNRKNERPFLGVDNAKMQSSSIMWPKNAVSFPENKKIRPINNYIPGKFFFLFGLREEDFGDPAAYKKFHELAKNPIIARSEKNAQGIIFCNKQKIEHKNGEVNKVAAKMKVLGTFGGFRVYCKEEKLPTGETLLIANTVVHRH